jgi:uncharacterized protein (TIGR02996 family)
VLDSWYDVAVNDEPRNPELDAAVAANPGDVATYQVLADWLESQGCLPRAQLIRMQIADPFGADPGPVRKLMHDWGSVLLGKLVHFEKDLRWTYGYVSGAYLRQRPEHVEELLTHASGRFVQGLAVEFEDVTPVVPVIAVRAPPTVRELSLSSRLPAELRGLAAVFSRVDRLTFNQNARLVEALALPRVTQLHGFHRQTPEGARILAEADLPKLRELHLDFGDATARPEDFAALFARDLPAIAELSLARADDIDALCERLVEAPFASRLVRLTIGGALTRAGLEAILGSARLTALTVLNVMTATLERHEVKAVSRAYARAGLHIIDQRSDDTDD